MEYETIFNYFLSRIQDRSLLGLSETDYSEKLIDYLTAALSYPEVRNIFVEVSRDDDAETLTYTLVSPIDENADSRFVLDVLTRGMVVAWMGEHLDADYYLALAIGGKEEKMLKNDLKTNHERYDYLKRDLQKTISRHGYYTGSFALWL